MALTGARQQHCLSRCSSAAGLPEEPSEEPSEDAEQQQEERQEQQSEQEATAAWQPGCVSVISDGAVQLQELLDAIAEAHHSSSSMQQQPPYLIIDWHAPWVAASVAASQQLVALAAAARHVHVVTLDVTLFPHNRALALEKVMEVPQAYRKGGRRFLAVPKSGA
jgi:hypothetical protein